VVFIMCSISAYAQPDRWQQRVDYIMNIDFDVSDHTFSGTQTLKYTNNSPDTLNKVFYHLYFNAFQPGSMMDIRSQNLPDPDRRVRDRISKLTADEIGKLYPAVLTHNGTPVNFEVVGTILEVTLKNPILPGSTAELYMEFDGQVPKQIRRSGRDNKEGIDYSMSQWYPKMANYDYQGWHANPYIAREFYGIWGDFDVSISIDPFYTIAATGVLQNPEEIGHGYQQDGETSHVSTVDKPLTWRFKAENVIDFVWAADPEYKHVVHKMEDGTVLRFFYVEDEVTQPIWESLPERTAQVVEYMNEHFGAYPYPQYSVIQGGDGGMEYPMATLLTGRGSGTFGTTVHELIHSWFQNTLATNESLYAWMDEGFTSYASTISRNALFGNSEKPFAGTYARYLRFVNTGLEEPSSTHSDHFSTNSAYSRSAYTKGAIFLHQLSYIIGKDAFQKGMLNYYNTWKFKHPNPNDFIRIMEKESDLELDWYKEYWINTTKLPDYAIDTVRRSGVTTSILLNRVGDMPMPIDVVIELKNGEKVQYNIPLRIMRGEKKFENDYSENAADWPWTHPEYILEVNQPIEDISSIEIDPTGRLFDTDYSNNKVILTN